MSLKRYLVESARFVAVSTIATLLSVLAINLYGFLVGGRLPRSDSAQGGGTLYFIISLLLGPPLGIFFGIAWMFHVNDVKKLKSGEGDESTRPT